MTDVPHSEPLTASVAAEPASARSTSAITRIAAGVRSSVGSLSHQFTLVVAIAVAPVLLALVIVSALMVLSDHEAVVVAAIVVAAGVLAAVGAKVVANGILHDVEIVRDGLRAVGHGERGVAIETTASDELAELAQAANAMISRPAGRGGGARSEVRIAPGGTWSRRSRTICGPRSPRCGCSPRPSATTSSSIPRRAAAI